MAAVAAVFGALLREGDVVVMPRGSYFLAAKLLEERFVARGVTVRTVAAGEMATAEAVRGARLVWVETPSNPELEITDIAAVVAAAKAEGVLVAVDNTTATPLAQRPLELGADVSVSSDSKMMCGHSDVLLGHVAARDAELVAQIDRERTLTGGIAGPMEAWLLLRSLATLPLRLERSSDNAQQVAEFLAGRKGVSGVVYPGLKGHPGHEVARRQMRYFGPVVGFALESQAAAERFLQRAELVTECTSFGGVTTTAERRRRWGHDAVPEGFIRMSVGCEAVEDLLGDFERALR
jgi:cystathionine gamma-lyase